MSRLRWGRIIPARCMGDLQPQRGYIPLRHLRCIPPTSRFLLVRELALSVTERFYKGRRTGSNMAGGTGLGLAIVKRILALHQSKLILESAERIGTTASFELDVALA